MPNPLDTNRIKVVRVFDPVCTNVVGSLAELILSVVCASYSRVLLVVVGLLRTYGPKYTVVALICSQAIICLPHAQKPVSECYVIEQFIGQLWSGMSIALYLMQSEGCAS